MVDDSLKMQRETKSHVRERSESRVPGSLSLIRQTHDEHDARIAMSDAIHEAEVFVIGAGDNDLDRRVAQRIGLCGGRLAAAIGPDTRFLVRAERATTEDVDAASVSGLVVIDETEFERMIDVFLTHTSGDQVRAAARRAVEENRVASSIRTPEPPVQVAAASARQMVTARRDAKRGVVAPRLKPLTEDEQDIELHARNVRSLHASTPFRDQRQPLVQPR
jgi:hypothetical protein